MNPLLALGPHIFSIAPLSYQRLETTVEAKWPAISRFGTAPGRQFTGLGEDPITISGLMFPHELGGLAELDALRASVRAAKPVLMVGWAGATAARVLGEVVLLKVTDTAERIDRQGQPRKVSYDIEVAPFRNGGKPVGLFL